MEIIKREREQAKAKKLKQQSKVTEPEHGQGKKQEPIDTSPPPEPHSTTSISRQPTREELNNKITYIDKNRIEPLYFAVDDLVHEVKAVSDRQKALEAENKALSDRLKVVEQKLDSMQVH